jgi:EAL domain-containing protein (putative c-di-GMP-specific phosphodiesterase class I)
MQKRDWWVVGGLAVLAFAAGGAASFMMAAGTAQGALIAGAALLLVVAQIAALAALWLRAARLDAHLTRQHATIEGLSAEAAGAAERVGRIERQLAGDQPARILHEMHGLRDTVQALAKNVADNLAGTATPPKPEPAPAVKGPAQPSAAGERLELLLEPVIELATGVTAFYRAQVGLVGSAGDRVSHADLMRKADGGNMRAALDIHVLKLALPVLRRLRARNPGMRLLVPIGSGSLQSEDALLRLIGEIEGSGGAVSGLVLEIVHGDLAALDARGIEGLARLARLGITLALNRVSVAGLDLAALRQLGVRFLDIAATAFAGATGLSPAWTEFTQFARAMQFHIVAGAIESAEQAAFATKIARYGYGPHFAPARKVRADAGRAAGNGSRTEAA